MEKIDAPESLFGDSPEELDLNSYAEIADIIIERPDIAQLGKTVLHGWNANGDYV